VTTTDPLRPNGDGLVRTSSGEQAALYVRRLIFTGQLKPGSRVPQDDIARALGISRIPLREGLIALEREGWVTLEMHRGAFVNALDERSVRDHYELFGLIYGYTVRHSMERSGDELVERLAAIERRLKAAQDPQEVGAQALRFHAAVIDGARSGRIKAVLRAMSTIVPGDDFFGLVPGAIDVERRSVAALVRAIRRGDADRAANEYQRMMRAMADLVVEVLRDEGMFDTAADRPAAGAAGAPERAPGRGGGG
jgi:DNA-binding GntR family transcriptional regulator